MRRLRSFLCLIAFAAACSGCDGFVLIVSSGPLPPAKSSPTGPAPRPIFLGEVVHDTFVTPEVCFDFRAPATGVLFVRLSWDPREGDIDFTFVSAVFASLETVSASTGQKSTTGSLRVTAGQMYRIAVTGRQGPVPFTLNATMQ
jgi:hypothetical protein